MNTNLIKKLIFMVFFIFISINLYSKYKIGIVYDIGGRGDKSFNDSAYEGLVMLAKKYKGYIEGDPSKVNYGNEIILKYLEPKSGGQDKELLLRVLAEDGYNLVIGVGFAFSDAIRKVAKDFPKTYFAIVDGYIENLKEDENIVCLLFRENEGSFLVGALAGLISKNDKIGFVGGMDISLIHKFQAGYMAGAQYVNKNLRKDGMILCQYIGKDPTAFKDAPMAYNIASGMYKQGVSIIFQASGASGEGVFKAAEEYKKYAIGTDSDQGYIYSTANDKATKERGKYIVTSMLKKVDNSIFQIGEELITTGRIKCGYKSFGIKENGVDIAVNEFNNELLKPYLPQINSLKEKIIKKEIIVPEHDNQIKEWGNKYLK